jgi:L-asparagine oxygenase
LQLTAELQSMLLEANEREALACVLRALPYFRMEDLDGRLADEVASRRSCLPPRLARVLVDFDQRPGPTGAMLIRGLPIDDELPHTPRDGRPSPSKTGRMSESLLVLVAGVLGSVIGYREEKEGMLIHDVCPQPGREERQENSGSIYFDVHTENAFHPFRPDHVLLLCLREDVGGSARTLVASARSVCPLLSRRDIELLREPWFRHRMPTSFQTGDDSTYSLPRPVLTGSDDDPQMCVDAFNTVAMNDDARAALERLVSALKSELTGWALATGDLLVVDNRRAVHARTGFVPRYDGFDRWLQRAFTVRDFARSCVARQGNSHVCTLPPGIAS